MKLERTKGHFYKFDLTNKEFIYIKNPISVINEARTLRFFQNEALSLKKANILEQRGAAAPLAPLWTRPWTLILIVHFYLYNFVIKSDI